MPAVLEIILSLYAACIKGSDLRLSQKISYNEISQLYATSVLVSSNVQRQFLFQSFAVLQIVIYSSYIFKTVEG